MSDDRTVSSSKHILVWSSRRDRSSHVCWRFLLFTTDWSFTGHALVRAKLDSFKPFHFPFLYRGHFHIVSCIWLCLALNCRSSEDSRSLPPFSVPLYTTLVSPKAFYLEERVLYYYYFADRSRRSSILWPCSVEPSRKRICSGCNSTRLFFHHSKQKAVAEQGDKRCGYTCGKHTL